MFLIVAGIAAALSLWKLINRDNRQRAEQELRRGWEMGMKPDPDQRFRDSDFPGRRLLKNLEWLEEAVARHNANIAWHEEEVKLRRILPDEESLAEFQSAAQLEFKILGEFSIGAIAEGRQDISQSLRVAEVLTELSQKRKVPVSELLQTSPTEEPVHQELASQAKQLWELIQKNAAAQNAKNLDHPPAGAMKIVDPWPTLEDNQVTGQPSRSRVERVPPSLPLLVTWLQDIMEAGDIAPEELGITPAAAKEVIKIGAKKLLQDISRAPHGAMAMSGLVGIRRLAQLGGLTNKEVEELVGTNVWRETLGNLAKEMFEDVKFWSRPEGSSTFQKQAWEELKSILEFGNLKPSDPEVKIPDDEFQKFKKDLGALEPVKDRSEPEPNPVPVKIAHNTILRHLFVQMRQEATSPEAALLATEATVITAKATLGVTTGWFLTFADFTGALTSVAVTVKLAKFTGNQLRKLAGKPPV